MSLLDSLVARGIIEPDVPLAPLTTYKLGGPARWLAEPATREQLVDVLRAVTEAGTQMMVLGRGSNMVVADGGFDGVVVRLAGAFNEIDHRPDAIGAGGAVSLPMLARSAVAGGRLGLEFYVGIPGSVGGAVRQNAGCHGSDTRDVLVVAEVVTAGGDTTLRSPDELQLSYRHSNLGDHDIVVSATFRFRAGDPGEGEEIMREVIRWRKEHQPGGTLNAGSVFKNPEGEAAGAIIDRVGLKGFAVGGASVSTRHANFFVAEPGTSAADVYELVRRVRRRVFDATGIELDPEIRFVGFDRSTQ